MSGYWRHLAAQAQDRSALRLVPAPQLAPAWSAPGDVEPPAAAPSPRHAVPRRDAEVPAAVVDTTRQVRGEDRTAERLAATDTVAGRADASPWPRPARPSTLSLPQADDPDERVAPTGRGLARRRAPDGRRPDPRVPPGSRPRSAGRDAARARPTAAAAATHAAEDGDGPGAPAVPDVHIHIGRVELTALAAPAPAPARSRAPAAGKSLSLDDYLHGKRRR